MAYGCNLRMSAMIMFGVNGQYQGAHLIVRRNVGKEKCCVVEELVLMGANRSQHVRRNPGIFVRRIAMIARTDTGLVLKATIRTLIVDSGGIAF